jgi:hypothetical protein
VVSPKRQIITDARNAMLRLEKGKRSGGHRANLLLSVGYQAER